MKDLTFKIAIPTDNGFWGRECKGCQKYFKIHSDKIKDELHCPYCGNLQPNADLWTKEQQSVTNKLAQEIGRRLIEDEMGKMLEKLARNSKTMSYKRGSRSSISKITKHVEKEVDTELECSNCNMAFQVYGIFGFCPGCKEDNVLIYEANLSLLLKEIESSTDPKRSLRHAYNDLVSTFENYCKRVAQRNGLDAINFQNLGNVKDLFKQSNLDIYFNVSFEEKVVVKRVFEKRHCYQHSQGIITEKYVKNIPEDRKLLNTLAVLSKEEFIQALSIVKKILRNITNHFN